MVIRQGLALTAGGLIVGAALAFALARAVASVSFTNSAMGSSATLLGMAPTDPLIYMAAAVFLCVIAATRLRAAGAPRGRHRSHASVAHRIVRRNQIEVAMRKLRAFVASFRRKFFRAMRRETTSPPNSSATSRCTRTKAFAPA